MSAADGKASPEPDARRSALRWAGLTALWFLGLWLIPDPRPLGAPEWAVGLLRSLIGLSEPSARAVATIALRGMGLAVLAVLLAQVFKRLPLKRAAPIVLLAAPLLAIAAQWLNYGYFPIEDQIYFGLVSAILGGLLGLGLRKNRVTLIALLVLVGSLFVWGTSTGIPDDLHEAARATARHVLEEAEDVPAGDEGFARLLHIAFTHAHDNSHRTGGVFANRAAILALGVILGEEKVAWVAKRPVDPAAMKQARKLRAKITVRGRGDLSRHFWVSAALAVLSDDARSMSVGITKELMDSTPGGSGFSFVDLTADRAGTLFTLAATRDAASAHALQARIRNGVRIADYVPEIEGLPEGIMRDEFQDAYGGLGGAGTARVVAEILKRLATCAGLK